MRKSRNAEVVTSSHHESDEEDQEQSVDESEEDDWQPEDKPKKGAKGGPKRKSVATPKGKASKKSKKEESEEESEEEEDDDDEDYDSDESDEDESGGKGKNSGGKKTRTPVGKNQPDKDGYMELYLFKNDLTKEFRSEEKLCMWRRDGNSLLQKYMMVKEESQNTDIVFKASSVYSCWEEKRKNDFFQIKVQLVGDKKDAKVKVVDVDEFEKYAVEDRPKVDITPKGAEGGEAYEEGSEDEEEEEDEE